MREAARSMGTFDGRCTFSSPSSAPAARFDAGFLIPFAGTLYSPARSDDASVRPTLDIYDLISREAFPKQISSAEKMWRERDLKSRMDGEIALPNVTGATASA